MANTLITAALFSLLSAMLHPAAAYTVAFAVGIAIAVGVTPGFVFGARTSSARRAAFAAWYLVVYGVGLVTVLVLHDVVGAGRPVVVGATLLVTATLSFLGGRRLFEADRSGR